MRRRELITLLGGVMASWPLAVGAQQTSKLPSLGFLTAGRDSPGLPALLEGLGQFGWIEGKTIAVEYRYAENRNDRLPELAAELVRLNVDVIVAAGTLAPLAAKRATATIPIVMTSAGDPLGTGLVSGLARPGGNVTGLSLMSPDISGKRLELIEQIVPDVARVAIMWNATNPYPALVFRQTENAARQLKLEVQSLEVHTPDDVTSALEAAVREKANALITVEDPLTVNYRKQIADFAIKNRVPTMSGLREYVDAGGLLSYGPALADLYRRAAGYVDKILKGAKPSELPVEQPTKFELVINLKTAKTLGVTIPPDMLAIADAVIE
jgi:putative tryptophan/tyrosine transport system substrate-binding protein